MKHSTRGLLLGLAFLAGCQRQQQATAPAAPPPTVTTAKPVLQEVTDYQEYTGYLEAVETVSVRTRVRGFLQRIAFTEGGDVGKDQLLYEIDPREYQAALDKAKADLARANAVQRLAASEEERAARLRRSNAMSDEEYTQRLSALETAQASVRQAQAAVTMAELDLSFTKISSPIAGRISRTLVTVGNLVGYNESTVLTTIVRMHPIYVNFDVPELFALKFDQLARQLTSPGTQEGPTIPVDVGVGNEQGYPHHGKINFRENRVDIGTGTIRLRATVPNDDRSLYPGLYVRIRVPESAPQQRSMIPEAALMTDQRGRYLYVLKPDNTVEARTVTVGSKVGPLIAIVTGLKGDETIIINGLQRARPGMKVTPQLVPLSEPGAGKTPPAKADNPVAIRPAVGTNASGGNGKTEPPPGKQ